MRPIDFPQSNKVLLDNNYRSDLVTEITSLHVWTNDDMCVSCWKLSWKERFQALFYGKIWVYVLSGGNQPPIDFSVENDIWEDVTQVIEN